MDEAEKKRLESLGYWVGDYGDFLGLTDAEREHVELRISLSRAIKRAREAKGMSPRVLAKRIGVTPSQVTKVETGTVEVSLDLMFRAYFEAGGKLGDLVSGKSSPAPEATPAAVPVAPVAKPGKRLARSG